MSLKRLFLLLWLLASAAGALPKSYPVEFHCDYAPMQVYRYIPEQRKLEYLGNTTRAVELTVQESQWNEKWILRFFYQASGQGEPDADTPFNLSQEFRVGDLIGWGRAPQVGELHAQLTLRQKAVWWTQTWGRPYWPLWTVLGVAAGVGGWMLRRRRPPTAPGTEPGATTLSRLSWELDPGSCLGDYTIVERLGEGATAVVYRVRQRGEDPPLEYALKLMKPGEIRGGDVMPRFRREMRALTQLRHPHLPFLKDFGEDGGLIYLVMELLSHESLGSRLKGGPLAWREALPWLGQLASALAAAHHKGVLHRDIKPDNVVFGKDGRLKLTDFGLARDEEATTVTAEGAWLGTPIYMAPELFQGSRASAASDQYALGVLAYQLLAGHTPFRGDSPLALAVQHLQNPVPPLGDEVPAELARVIMRMLDKDPEARFESIPAVQAALEKAGGSA